LPIQKATIQQTKEILKYAIDVMNEATVGFVVPSWQKAKELIWPFLNNGGYYLVYIENNTIQGWIGIGATYDFYTDQVIGIIPELYVLPPFRKKGIAKQLCIEACRQLNRMGYDRIQLNVFEGNHAKQLYRKLGFRDIYTTMELTGEI